MISRRTGWLIWSSLLFPISILMEIKNFEIPLPMPSFLLPYPNHHYHPFWDVTAAFCFIVGGLCILLIPFSLMRDFARKNRQAE